VPPPAALQDSPLRSWFPEAGVLICRPAVGTKGGFGVALKGGHNNEHHNHNDLGSYVVTVNDTPVLVDPGAEVYTSRTFSSRRYDSKVLNSWGHPVPVVAGKLQRTGSEARARVLETRFDAGADTLTLDLSSAYAVPELKKLARRFSYVRHPAGSLTVEDWAVFSAAREFETALVTLGKVKTLSPSLLEIRDGEAAVHVSIESAGSPFEIRTEEVREDVHTRSLPTRIGIRLVKPVTEAKMLMRITPVPPDVTRQ
jgi:hypothetical protein